MNSTVEVLDKEKNWIIRSIEENDLKILEYGKLYRRYRCLMKLSFEDHRIGKKVYLVAEAGHGIAGQIVIDWRILKDETKSDGKTRAYLYSFRVFPPYQKQGLGSAMVAFCEKYLFEHGFKYATIACEKKNPDALRLYQKLGYKIFKDENVGWEFTDDNGVLQKISEPEWVLEKALF